MNNGEKYEKAIMARWAVVDADEPGMGQYRRKRARLNKIAAASRKHNRQRRK